MADLNCFNGLVKILEIPKEKILNDNFNVIRCKVELPQVRGNKIVMLNIWGRLTKNIIKNYKISDYILVEGYISVRFSSKKNLSSKVLKKAEISALKVYPYILNNYN